MLFLLEYKAYIFILKFQRNRGLRTHMSQFNTEMCNLSWFLHVWCTRTETSKNLQFFCKNIRMIFEKRALQLRFNGKSTTDLWIVNSGDNLHSSRLLDAFIHSTLLIELDYIALLFIFMACKVFLLCNSFKFPQKKSQRCFNLSSELILA